MATETAAPGALSPALATDLAVGAYCLAELIRRAVVVHGWPAMPDETIALLASLDSFRRAVDGARGREGWSGDAPGW